MVWRDPRFALQAQRPAAVRRNADSRPEGLKDDRRPVHPWDALSAAVRGPPSLCSLLQPCLLSQSWLSRSGDAAVVVCDL